MVQSVAYGSMQKLPHMKMPCDLFGCLHQCNVDDAIGFEPHEGLGRCYGVYVIALSTPQPHQRQEGAASQV
jgi:hypothetical protein